MSYLQYLTVSSKYFYICIQNQCFHIVHVAKTKTTFDLSLHAGLKHGKHKVRGIYSSSSKALFIMQQMQFHLIITGKQYCCKCVGDLALFYSECKGTLLYTKCIFCKIKVNSKSASGLCCGSGQKTAFDLIFNPSSKGSLCTHFMCVSCCAGGHSQ